MNRRNCTTAVAVVMGALLAVPLSAQSTRFTE